MNNSININSLNTINEIFQQPFVWEKIKDQVESHLQSYQKTLEAFRNYKIILTGAGTSQFVGDAIYPYFYRKGLNIISIPTTDIVANPYNYLREDERILLISFGRSGNSPESVATFNIANKIVKDIFHLVITCNEEGQLAKNASQLKNCKTFLLPKEANDKGFAMTSSFSGMTIFAFLLLSLMLKEDSTSQIKDSMKYFISTLSKIEPFIRNSNIKNNDRVIFLGNSEFKGFSVEAHLKLLELTQGKISSFYNGMLAFRHGPKSLLNQNSTVIFLMSKDPYSRKYEYDLIFEIAKENVVKQIIILDNQNDNSLEEIASKYFNFETKDLNEILIGLFYILFSQLIAVKLSLNLGINPDNPCPSGEVNRVVQGVNIYEDFV